VNGVLGCAGTAQPLSPASVSIATRPFRSTFGAARSTVTQPAKRQPSGPSSNWLPKRPQPANYQGTNLSFYAAFCILFEPVGINPLTPLFCPRLTISARLRRAHPTKASAVSGDQMSSEIRVCLQCKGRIGSMRGARAKFCSGICRGIYQRNVKQGGKELSLTKLSIKGKKKGSVLFHDCIFGGGGGLDPFTVERCKCKKLVSKEKAESLVASRRGS
jgi:hypothetical protein